MLAVYGFTNIQKKKIIKYFGEEREIIIFTRSK